MIGTIQNLRETDENLQNMRSLLVFLLGGQAFALNIETVVQIIPMLKLTAVPQVDHMIEGVANVHGKIIPVISARSHLGMPEQKPGLYTPIILAKAGERQLGLIVDQVTDVISVPEESIVAPGSILPDGMENSPVMSGLVYRQDFSVLVLDPRYLLRPSQFRRINQAANTVPQLRIEEPYAEEGGPAGSTAPERQAFEAVRAALAEKLNEPSPINQQPASKPVPVTVPVPPAPVDAPPASTAPLQPADAVEEPAAAEPPPATPKKNGSSARRGKRKDSIIPATAADTAARISSHSSRLDSLLADRFAALADDLTAADGDTTAAPGSGSVQPEA